MNANVLLAQFGQLTLADILAEIPHDAGALIVYVLVAVLLLFVWHGSRRSAPGTAATASSDAPADRLAAPPPSTAGPGASAHRRAPRVKATGGKRQRRPDRITWLS